MDKPFRTQGDLQRALHLSKSGMSKLLDHPDFPEGVSTSPPWSVKDFDAIFDWRRRELEPSRNATPRQLAQRVSRHPVFRPYERIDHDSDSITDLLNEPVPVTLPIEREILTGKRTLSPEEVRGLVAAIVALKASLFDEVGELITWRDNPEAAGRLNDKMHRRCNWYRELIGSYFGLDAVGPYEPIDEPCIQPGEVAEWFVEYEEAINPKPPKRGKKSTNQRKGN